MIKKLNYIGNLQIKAVDGFDKVTGQAKYIGDMNPPGMLHAKLLLSPVPHAKIVRLDIGPALRVDGVVAALCSDDFYDHGSFGWPVKDAYVLAYQKVRYVGEPISVVAAESSDAAAAGVMAILLDLEDLPAVTDPRQALGPSAPIIPHDPPLCAGNLCAEHIVRNGNPESVIDRCSFVLDEHYRFAHQEHAYLETEGVLAIPEAGSGVTIYANNQSPHINRDNVAAILRLEKEEVRVVQPPVGGSFGGKDDCVYQLSAQAAKLALLTNRPVRLLLNREESMRVSYKRAAMDIHIRIGAGKDGRLRAVKTTCLVDSGAYASMTPLSAWRATMHLAGAYRYDAATADTKAVYTNNGYSGAFRGFGNTQAAAASEIAVDELANLIGDDPIEFRLKNCIQTGDVAFTGNYIEHEVGLSRCLEWVRDASDWLTKRSDLPSEKSTGSFRGIGVACYFHGAGLGGEGLDYARTTIQVERDHSITLQSGITDYGQGSRTVFSIIVAEILGISPERIHMLRPDTQTALESGPTVASRATVVGGNATRVAARRLQQTLELAAADLLSCEVNQIIRDAENFIGPTEEQIPIEGVIDYAFEAGYQLSSQGYWQIPLIHWDFEAGNGTPYFTYSFGAQVAEVDVNAETGEVKVIGIWASHDGGKIIFPNGAQGQLIGGIAQGIGYALMEGFFYKGGFPQKFGYDEYRIPTAIDVPEIEFTFVETRFPDGPFGAKNLAEPVMIATAPAIVNAVYHATGARCRTLPISRTWLSERIKKE